MAKMNMMLIAIVVIVVIIIGIGLFFVFSKPSSQGYNSNKGTTVPYGYSTSIIVGHTTSIGQGSYRTYKGTYKYIVPLGPGGERVQGNNVSNYNSIQTVSGTFSFTTNSSSPLDTGYGSGSGASSIKTSGFCQGTNTTSYTFPVNTLVFPNQTNITIFFGSAKPSNSTVQLSCTNSTKHYSLIGNYSYLSVYPNDLSINRTGGTVNVILSGGISYNITITSP